MISYGSNHVQKKRFFQALHHFLISFIIMFYFDDGHSLRFLARKDQSNFCCPLDVFLLIMHDEGNGWEIFFLGYSDL